MGAGAHGVGGQGEGLQPQNWLLSSLPEPSLHVSVLGLYQVSYSAKNSPKKQTALCSRWDTQQTFNPFFLSVIGQPRNTEKSRSMKKKDQDKQKMKPGKKP